jgi:hypothetical protein
MQRQPVLVRNAKERKGSVRPLWAMLLPPIVVACAACDDSDKRILRCEEPSSVSTRAEGKFRLGFADSLAQAPAEGYIATVEIEDDGYVKLQACASDENAYWYIVVEQQAPRGAKLPLKFDNVSESAAHASAFVEYCLQGDCAEPERHWYGYPLSEQPLTLAETSGTLDALERGSVKSSIKLTDVTQGSSRSSIVIETDLEWNSR